MDALACVRAIDVRAAESRIRPEGQLHVFLGAIAGHRVALDDCERSGHTVRRAEVPRALDQTCAELRQHCERYGLPMPAGIPEESS